MAAGRGDTTMPLFGKRVQSGNRIARVVFLFVPAVPAILASGCGDTKENPPRTPLVPQPTIAAVPKGQPLRPGDKLPPLTAAGWINGQPPPPGTPGTKLLVVDLWASWCPYCRDGAPSLVNLFKKYQAQGVAFVSITNLDEGIARAFTQEFSIPWPSGFGLGVPDMALLGVNSGIPAAGYGLAPTLYLVDGSGTVRWSDKQGRFSHTPTREWIQQLDDAIKQELKDVESVK